MTMEQQHIVRNQNEKGDFLDFVKRYTDEKQIDWTEGYYPANVVIDAYEQGRKEGRKQGEKDAGKPMEEFVQGLITTITSKAMQAYTYAHLLTDFLLRKEFKVEGFFVRIDRKTPNVIVVVNEDTLLNDDFVELAYKQMAKLEVGFKDQFGEIFSMSLVSSDNLDTDALNDDGYKYHERTAKDKIRGEK